MNGRLRPHAARARARSLPAVHPNQGVAASYLERLRKLLSEFEAELVGALSTTWEANPPALQAKDAVPIRTLMQTVKGMGSAWQTRMDTAAEQLAEYFAASVEERSSARLQTILQEAGLSVRFRRTAAMLDVEGAVIAENVALIKSIASELLTDVEVSVSQSVAAGRDLATLTKELRERFGASKKRAAFIARDQNNKATAFLVRARQLELGITHAVWMHSGAGKQPRPDHVAFAAGLQDGPVYEIKKGAFISGEWIHPGQLPNCRCTSRPLLPGGMAPTTTSAQRVARLEGSK